MTTKGSYPFPYYIGGDSPDSLVQIACGVDDKVIEQQIGFSDKYKYLSYTQIVRKFKDWYNVEKEYNTSWKRMRSEVEDMLMEVDLHTASPSVVMHLLDLQYLKEKGEIK